MKNWFKNKSMENKDVLQNEEILQDDINDQAENGSDMTDKGESDSSKQEMGTLQAQISELKNKLLYQQAEFDNYRKRVMKEKADTILSAARDTMTAMLPVLDDFDRASKNEEFTEGVNLVYLKMQTILKSKGLKEMDSPAGSDFDPELHEAITEVPMGEEMVGKVVDTVERGYLLNEKIIRFAKVVVGR
jgi:molecular chaperone GrpE